MKYNSHFLLVVLCLCSPLQSSWSNFLHPLDWYYNLLSSQVKEVINKAAAADDTDEARNAFAQEFAKALENNPDDIPKGSLLPRIYYHCMQQKKPAMAYVLIRTALDHGTDPNVRGRKEINIILNAHDSNDSTLMEIVAGHGADLLMKDNNGNYIFHEQIKKNNKEMVAVFLKQDAIQSNINVQGSRGETALLLATKAGFKDVVQSLLEHNAHPDLSDHKNTAPLHAAVECGFNDIAQLLLEHNANPNLCDQGNTAPLHTAVTLNNAELATKLLTYGAAINSSDAQGNSALLLACKNGHDDIIKILIQHGADAVINKGNKQGEYPLFTIMRHAFKQTSEKRQNTLVTIKIMLLHGADTRLKDNYGNTMFTLASSNNAIDVMNILKEHDPGLINESDEYGDSPLHNAAQAGAYETIQYLIYYGAKINHLNKQGQTPLLCAIEKGHPTIATILLAEGATVNQVDKNGNTIWHYLAFANKSTLDWNQIITDEGASLLNTKNNDGNAPLHIAAQNGNRTLVQFFLDHGVRLDITNQKQQNALHLAAQKSADILKLLLEKHGSNQSMNAQDEDGNTPLHNAAAAGNVKCLQLLLNKQVAIDIKNNLGQTPFNLSCKKLQKTIVRVLMLNQRANPNKCDNKGYAGIHHIAESGDVNTLHEFLASAKQIKEQTYVNINIQTKDDRKVTALHIVTIKERVDCVELLIEAGANVNACDNNGNTPLHYASTNASICKLLLKSANIDPNLQNEKSLTPLHIALDNHATHCIDLLIKNIGVNPNSKDAYQRAPLYYAFNSEYALDYTAKLLQHPAINPNELTLYESSLHAAFDKDFELLKPLLSHAKIDLDIKNKDGHTIWERATHTNQIQKLLDVAYAINTSGEISWSHKEKIRLKIFELEKIKNGMPPPVNPEYKEEDAPIPAPFYPELTPVSYPNAQPSAPADNPPPVNPEWEGK